MIKHFKNYKILIFLLIFGIFLFIFWLNNTLLFNIGKTSNNIEDFAFEYSEKNGIKILDIKDGDPYNRGFFHGKELRSDIGEVLNYFKDEVLGNDKYLGRPAYHLLSYKAKKFLDYIPEEYVIEMKGVADGSGVGFNDILLINTYDDLLNLSGCSTMILPKKSGFSNDFYHTRNLDYNMQILAKYKIVLKYKTHVSVGFPGHIGVLTGLGEKGISLSSHTSYSIEKPDYGIPATFLYRKIVEEASNLEEAKNIVKKANRTIANNIALGSYMENTGVVVEVTNTKFSHRSFLDDNKALISTNYFISDALFDNNRTFGKDRYLQYHEMIGNLSQIDYDKIKEIVSYYDPNIPGWGTIANRGTVQSVIMLPEIRKVFIANGKTTPVTNGDFIEISF